MRMAGLLKRRLGLPGAWGVVVVGAFLALFAGVVCCAGQDAPQKFSVNGVVENRITHQPISRALVEAFTDAVLTDSEGRFELQLPQGDNYLAVRRPGYEGSARGQPMAQVHITVSETMQPVTVFLTPVGSITGHVTLSSGDEAGGLHFVLHMKQISVGHARWTTISSAVTDNDGTFRLTGLGVPASYVLCIEPSPDRSSSSKRGAPIMGYPGACYPGGFDLKSAIGAPLLLSPGQEAQLEILLTRQAFYPVSISVAGSGPRRFSAFTIFDQSGSAVNAGARMDAETGAYLIHLPSGSYYAEAREFGEPPRYGRVDFTVAGAGVSGINLVPAPVVPIPVEVRKEFTANQASAPEGVRVPLRFSGMNGDQAPVQISFDPVDRPLGGNIGVNLRREPGSADTFLMDPPPTGRYMLNVQTFGGPIYVASATSGTTDLLHEPLTIGPGSSLQDIQIVLRNDVGFLGCAKKAESGGTAEQSGVQASVNPVVAIPAGSAVRKFYETYTQDNKLGLLPSLPLPPGRYLVVAFETEPEIDLDDAEAMARLAGKGQTVVIEPGATVNVQVEPIKDDEEAR